MAVNVNFLEVQSRAEQKKMVTEALDNGASLLKSFTILPIGLSLRCKPALNQGKPRLAVGTFTTSTDRVIQGCYFNGTDETSGNKYFNFFVSLSDNEIDDLLKPANSKLDYHIVTIEYINSEGKSRTMPKLESIYS